jgi:hypothetical protein
VTRYNSALNLSSGLLGREAAGKVVVGSGAQPLGRHAG